MDRCALFVDAGYVLADGAMAVHGTRRRDSVSWDHAGLLKFLTGLARDRTGLPVLRCYWYEAAVDGSRTTEHDMLADLSGLKLRIVNVRPGRREGIETQLRRDLVALAKNGAICDAFIASANENLAEIVTEVQDLGVRVMILHITSDTGWTVPQSLRQESDDLAEVSGIHLRPYVDLIRGAEPATSEERYPAAAFGAPAGGSATRGTAAEAQGVAGLPASTGNYANPAADYRQGPQPYADPAQPYPGGRPQPQLAGQPSQHGAPQHSGVQPGQHGTGQHGTGQHGTGQHGAPAHGAAQPAVGQHAGQPGQQPAQQNGQPPAGHAAGRLDAAGYPVAGQHQAGQNGSAPGYQPGAGGISSDAYQISMPQHGAPAAPGGIAPPGGSRLPGQPQLSAAQAPGQQGQGGGEPSAVPGQGSAGLGASQPAGGAGMSTQRGGADAAVTPGVQVPGGQVAGPARSGGDLLAGSATDSGSAGQAMPGGQHGGAHQGGVAGPSHQAGLPAGHHAAGQGGSTAPGTGQGHAGLADGGAGQGQAGLPERGHGGAHAGGQSGVHSAPTGAHARHAGPEATGMPPGAPAGQGIASGMPGGPAGHGDSMHSDGLGAGGRAAHRAPAPPPGGQQQGGQPAGYQNGAWPGTSAYQADQQQPTSHASYQNGAGQGPPPYQGGQQPGSQAGYQNGAGQGRGGVPGQDPQRNGYHHPGGQQPNYSNGWPQTGQQAGFAQGGPPAGEPYSGPYPGGQPGAGQGGFDAAPTPGQPQPYGVPDPGYLQGIPGFVQDQGPRHGYGQPQPPHTAGPSFPPQYQDQPAAALPAVRPIQPVAISLPDAVKAAHAEGFSFGESVGRDAPALWLDAVLARKPRMPSDLEARLLQGSALPIDSLLHDEVRHSLRRGFWDALESARR